MAQTFIPGWETYITINAEDLTVVGNVLSFTRTKSSNPKPVFGQPFRHELPGQAGGSISAQGHVSVEKVQGLEDIFNSGVPVSYEIQAGTAAGSTDAGKWVGNLVPTEYTLDTDAEGEWEWSLNATLDGAPVYTPPTP
jgi:hypothetical protein